MAEELYLFHPENAHFKTGGHPIFEDVPEDQDSLVKKGEMPKMKTIPIVRTFMFFVENCIATHPIFSLKNNGYAKACSAMRIIDAVAAGEPGRWFPLREDDINNVRSIFADPGVGTEEGEETVIGRMKNFEVFCLRAMFDTFLNTRTSNPDDEKE